MTTAAADSPSLDALLAHATWARRLAYTLVRDDAAADDLVQEAWETAIQHPPDATRPVRPWLGQVIRNLFRMRLRERARRLQREAAAYAAAIDDAAPAVGADRFAEQLEQQRLLGELVLALDEPLRTTVLLRYFEGLSSADIATRQNIPAGTVRWRLKEGLARLRAALDRKSGGDRTRWQVAIVPLALLGARHVAAAPLPLKGAPMLKVAIASALVGAGVSAAVVVKHQQTPVASAAPAASSVAAPVASKGSTTLPRLSKERRAEMLQQIAQARASAPRPAKAAAASLDSDYIRSRLQEILPLIKECFEAGLERTPNLAGRIVLRFTVVGHEGIGGLVSDSQVLAEKTTLTDATVRECIQESVYAAQFVAPMGEGETVIEYPFSFSATPGPIPGDDDE